MKLKNISIALTFVVLAILIGAWSLPISNAKADEIVEPVVVEPVELVLTKADLSVKQFEKVNPMDYVVSGTFDTIDYSIVNTNETGTQNITYTAHKGDESIKLTKVIKVLDTKAPVIEGEDSVELSYGSEYVIESEFTAHDEVDGDVTVNLVADIDRSVSGEHTVVLTAVDSSGNEATKEVIITVLEDPEVIALRERNEEFSVLVDNAYALNNTVLANTSVSEIENMIYAVSDAMNYTSDYESDLSNLYTELSAKLVRAEDFYAPAPVVEVAYEAPVAQAETYNAPAPVTPAPSASGNSAVGLAMQYTGYAYVYGGSSPSTGFDCSGFTSYIYAQLGVYLPRTAAGQLYAGYGVDSPSVGDLVIYPGGGHVAIYIGNGQVVHALNENYGVVVTSMNLAGTPIAFRRVA